jgi:hypothetical protein
VPKISEILLDPLSFGGRKCHPLEGRLRVVGKQQAVFDIDRIMSMRLDLRRVALEKLIQGVKNEIHG